MLATDPRTGPEISRALRSVHDESVAYWRSFTPDAFAASLGGGWSAAETVRHLNKSIRPVAMAMRLPRLVLRLRFGGAKAPSRSYDEMRRVYDAALAAGADAGRFAPSPRPPEEPAAARERILAEHAAVVDALVEATGKWSETALDRLRLPHPRLGVLTVREMLFFTVNHNQHHVAVVRRKMESGAAEAAPRTATP